MQKKILMNGVVGISLGLLTTLTIASTPEGYWKSIDDRTGEQLSIVEVKKKTDGTYTGTIVYRYPVPGGGTLLTNCVKCPEPFKNKPILGLQIAWGLKQDLQNPNQYIDGRVLEPKTGNIYKGKAQLSADGKRMRMRGYMGISALGRTQVWIRTDSPNP
ncbi:hypothetical protein L313_0733 [Acinetobacter haemolyticus CIP 64.3 = MTCC 9819]|uniref:DUF2147 domain-containing protein n=1 Tax=Acinetobacter haemolyticus CIP 64.3 = MTCC 9819 TaxID=1217659 RepID=N9GJF8_ACIHA|nr:DUF2147 domain-containing protein [Acinetobacter haemolyticus]ENW17331.1 hypothetical protein F927_02273 [Acinetobacter haemolyticus CIP 64.3 = MTCC 9819]EPR89949.1 hypothetical protein L313_0733 [Acinetobacter haemolyticus CIP 64.3 = MTCC 9819]NAR97753.1 DUF2147 domain-containing protein [Acinetobacter haemolyticus]QXZ26302.1 DUF2147 domain-containing protein [Acinetobacter haemolyticus]SPT48508.1 signal peptide [Acinetobacter haemolyticus]